MSPQTKIHHMTMPAALLEVLGLQQVMVETWETALQQKKVQQSSLLALVGM